MKMEDILELETRACFDFFWNEANADKSSPGFGLVLDKNLKGSENMASIASVGFGLSAIVIGVERGYISKSEGEARICGTLATFLNNAEEELGFYYHFLDMKTAKKYKESFDCASIIDTSIFLNGTITAAQYFGGTVAQMFEELYARANWQKYYNATDNVFFMGYKNGAGFGAWDMYAEQMTQYILGVASPTYPVPPKIYKGFRRDLGRYGEYEFYNSPGGALFIHQFSHSWYSFKNKIDADGINWFENSVTASKSSRQYSIDNPMGYKSFHKDAWGLTACEGPNGYRAYGTPPFHPNCKDINDGTVAPCGAVGSIIFTPDQAVSAMQYYRTLPGLWGKYGFKDAYNQDRNWICDFVIGIDKGVSLLMIENYRSGLIHGLYMENKHVKAATEILGFKEIGLR